MVHFRLEKNGYVNKNRILASNTLHDCVSARTSSVCVCEKIKSQVTCSLPLPVSC